MTQRYKWVRFHELKTGENFFHGKFIYHKTSFFLGRAHLDGNAVVVMLWTRVRSTRPFSKAKDERPPQVAESREITPEARGEEEKCPSA